MKTTIITCKPSYASYNRTHEHNQAQDNQAQNRTAYDAYGVYDTLHTIKVDGVNLDII